MRDRAGAILTIDLGAVAANWRLLAGMVAPRARVAAVVKAEGYGLGAAPVARALKLSGCRRFFVATLEEGIELRSVLPDAEIGVFDGPISLIPDEFAEYRLMPVLNSREQVDSWAALARRRGARAPAVLQIDTGMSRLGLSRLEAEALAADREAVAELDLALVLSHLACSDQPEHPLNRLQQQRLRRLGALFPGVPASLAASSGIFLGEDYHFDWVRPGAALYGVNPSPGRPNPMRPVVALHGKILQVRDVDPGEAVGYGATWQPAAPARVAVVAVGYADGLPRALGNRGVAMLGDRRVPLVGRVSMDVVEFDVTGVPESLARTGAFVELLGPTLGLDDVAAAAGTIGYEILTRLGRRYRRRYLGLPEAAG